MALGKTSPRTKYHRLVWILWPVGGAVIGWAAFALHTGLMGLLFVWALLVSFIARRVRCPSCGKEVGLVAEGVRSFSRRRLIVPRECDQCGERLDEPAGCQHR